MHTLHLRHLPAAFDMFASGDVGSRNQLQYRLTPCVQRATLGRWSNDGAKRRTATANTTCWRRLAINGGLRNEDDAGFDNSAGSLQPSKPVVGMASG